MINDDGAMPTYEPTQRTAFPWHCPNCGAMVVGYRDERGVCKVTCRNCQTVMVRITKSRRSDVMNIFAPKNQVNQYI